jgi:phage major head subunit gpT-like protein
MQSTAWVDGVNFFATNHPVNMSDSSKGTYAKYATSKPLTIDNFADVYSQMLMTKRDDGSPLGVIPTHLMVPPSLRLVAKQILHAEIVGVQTLAGATQVGSNSNVLLNDVEPIVNPYLTEPTSWYLMDCSRGVKPLIFQQRTAPNLVPRVSPTDPNVFDKHLLQYSVEARGAFGVTLPFLIYKAVA